MLGKRPPSFLSYSFENKLCGTGRRSQTASGCGVDFVLVLQKKKKDKKVHRCSMCGPMLKVRPKKRREGIVWEQKGEEGEIRREVGKQAKTNEESRWERK